MITKTAAALLSAAMLVCAFADAQACSILDKRSVTIGLDEGVSGRCSNNGEPITCILEDDERWQCDGPMGTFHGFNLESVIVQACQCNLEEESERQKNEALLSE